MQVKFCTHFHHKMIRLAEILVANWIKCEKSFKNEKKSDVKLKLKFLLPNFGVMIKSFVEILIRNFQKSKIQLVATAEYLEFLFCSFNDQIVPNFKQTKVTIEWIKWLKFNLKCGDYP